MKAKHYRRPTVEVWPENWGVVQLFQRLASQWRVSAGGAIGLDYSVVYLELQRLGVAGDDFNDYLWRLGVIEAEALACMREG